MRGRCRNPKMVSSKSRFVCYVPVPRCYSVAALVAVEANVVNTIVPYSIVGRYVMQTACWEMPWFRALRAGALMLAVVLGLEWTVPLGGYAQPNQEPAQPNQASASAPAASVGNQDFPPMQELAVIEEPKPFYKKWWFWTIMAVVGVVVVAIATADSSGSWPLEAAPPP